MILDTNVTGQRKRRTGVPASTPFGVTLCWGVVLCCLSMGSIAIADEVFVDEGCGDAPDGSATNPYCTIIDGVDAIRAIDPQDQDDGDTVWVRPGTYTVPGDNYTFLGRGTVGYALRSTDGPATTTISGTIQISRDRSVNLLEGFTITTSTFQQNKTGLVIGAESPEIRGNVITGNHDRGVRIGNGEPVLVGNTISNNSVAYDDGGGIFITTTSDKTVKIVDSIIEGNESEHYTAGGVFVEGQGTLWLVNCLLRDNTAATDGGAMYTEGPSAARTTSPCNYTGLVRHLKMQNCVVACNEADEGGGLYINANVKADIVNTTFAGNDAVLPDPDEGNGGAIKVIGACVNIHNSILWDDESDLGPEIFAGREAEVTITYSILEGGCSGIEEDGDPPPQVTCDDDPGSGTVDVDNPDFLGSPCTPSEDLRVDSDSPAIDEGNNSDRLDDTVDLDGDSDTNEKTPLDLDRTPRIVNTIVDMGPYEYDECTSNNDCDDSDECNGEETCSSGYCHLGEFDDCNHNGIDDLCDISEGTSDDCNDNAVPDECEGYPDPVLTVLIDTSYACGDTLTRSLDHVLRFTFACDITAPDSGDVEIRELLANGQFGSDLSSSFIFTVEDDNVLRVEEDGTVLDNETWYAVLNDGGWSGVADFQMDYVVVRGDADNDGTTGGLDAGEIWGMRDLDPVPDDSRYDIDADGVIGGLDAGDAWGYRGSADPGKPSGHTCTLPYREGSTCSDVKLAAPKSMPGEPMGSPGVS